jgi:hypothetical protein
VHVGPESPRGWNEGQLIDPFDNFIGAMCSLSVHFCPEFDESVPEAAAGEES